MFFVAHSLSSADSGKQPLVCLTLWVKPKKTAASNVTSSCSPLMTLSAPIISWGRAPLKCLTLPPSGEFRNAVLADNMQDQLLQQTPCALHHPLTIKTFSGFLVAQNFWHACVLKSCNLQKVNRLCAPLEKNESASSSIVTFPGLWRFWHCCFYRVPRRAVDTMHLTGPGW